MIWVGLVYSLDSAVTVEDGVTFVAVWEKEKRTLFTAELRSCGTFNHRARLQPF